MEKKKTSYYYDSVTETLIDKGMQNYLRKNYGTSTLKMSTFIDMCIKDAVETLPAEITDLKEDIKYLKSKVGVLESLMERTYRTLDKKKRVQSELQNLDKMIEMHKDQMEELLNVK